MKVRRIDYRHFEVHDYYDHVIKTAEKAGMVPPRGRAWPKIDHITTPAHRSGSGGKNFAGFLITISAGTDINDIQHVVMHEVCHSIAGVNHGHDEVFYRSLLTLSRALKRDMAQTFAREAWYKPRGLRKAARALRLESRYMPRRRRARSTASAPRKAAEGW